jgi:hypothetical protein
MKHVIDVLKSSNAFIIGLYNLTVMKTDLKNS